MNEGPTRNKGLSSLRPIADASNQREVRAAPLDALDLGEGRIKLVKIDVEGAEQLVLEGMQRLLTEHRPYLIVEVTDRFLAAFGHSSESLCQMLKALGYAAYEITESGVAPLPHITQQWPAQFNALFSPAPYTPSVAKASK